MENGHLYWLEMRPAEQGRYVIVHRAPDGKTRDVTPAPYSARTLVHEYGGGSFLVAKGAVYFANFSDQRLYRQKGDGAPEALTPEGFRFADFCLDASRGRLLAVAERHEKKEVHNFLVAVSLDAERAPLILKKGADFYSDPRLSPDGKQLAWLQWDHPRLPWDGTELWRADVGNDGELLNPRLVAGGKTESIFQPSFGPDGRLYFVSDRSGFWNLYRMEGEKTRPLLPREAEFGRPQWVFRDFTYGFSSPSASGGARLLSTYTEKGHWKILELETENGIARELPIELTEIDSLVVEGRAAAFIGASPRIAASVVRLDIDSGRFEIVKASAQALPAEDTSIPEPIEFPTESGLSAHAFFYRPKNHACKAPDGEKPPLIVISHGGPTGATRSSYEPAIQYWTTRGFAVVDVNYGGSTGYGKAYRDRLRGTWGIVDVDDCTNAARFLADKGWVDGKRMAIRGGSAGGYTTLAALTFRNVFHAGASHYGVSDLELLSVDTHKFESRYNDYLVGPYPEALELIRSRSPIHYTDRLSCPLILFQGLEDKVVPPRQSELIFEAAKAKKLPVAYIPFAGEQHGFRRSENIRRALEAELLFYGKVFGFVPADPIEPFTIYNLD